ncbi:MAG: alpha-amylase family glycosyl hydrolase [Elusimicrobiota bacterium]
MDTNPYRKIYNLIRHLIAVYIVIGISYLYGSFTITAGTATLSDFTTVDISSDVAIDAGAVFVASGGVINIGRNWTKNDTGIFDFGTSTITFYTTYTSTLTGNTTFYCFRCETSAKELQFTEKSTQTVTNIFTLTGASGNLIKLRSTVDASLWYIQFPNSAQSVDYVDVKDSSACIKTVTANYSTDSGNNFNWIFPNNPPTISGLTQLAGSEALASMQWTNSSLIISSFTLQDPQAGDTVKFYLHVTSVTSGSSADWSQPFFCTTSAYLSQGTTGYLWTTLTDKATYWWRCWAEDSQGATSSTNTTLGQGGVAKFAFDNKPPDAISNLTALTGTQYDGDILLKWTAPGSDGAVGDFSGQYHIKWSTRTENITNFDSPPYPTYERYVSSSIIAQQEQVFTMTGLNPGTTYYFAIETIDTAGNTASWSTVGVNTANRNYALDLNPNPPPSLSAISNSSTTINLSWEKPVPLYIDDISYYHIFRATFTFTSTTTLNVILVDTVTHPTDVHISTGLAIHTTYYYRIVTFDKGDTDPGLISYVLNSITSTIVNACPQPTASEKVKVSVVYDNRSSTNTNNYGLIDGIEDADGTVTWDWPFIPDGGNITKYEIEVSTDINFSFYSSSAALSSTVSTYTATGLVRGKYHYARVRATNDEAITGSWTASDGIYVNAKTVDGSLADWSTFNLSTYNFITTYQGAGNWREAVWIDTTTDERGADDNQPNYTQLDIATFSITCDEYNLYMYVLFASSNTGGSSPVFDGRNFVQILIDNGNISAERVFRGRGDKYEDSYVSKYVSWEYLCEIVTGNDQFRVEDNLFTNRQYGKYTENNSGYFYEVAMPLSKLGGSSKFLGKTVNFTVATFWNDGDAIGNWSPATNSNIVDVVSSSGPATWNEVEGRIVDHYLAITFSTFGYVSSATSTLSTTSSIPDEPENASNGVSPCPPSALDYIMYRLFPDAWYNGDTTNDDIGDTNDYGGDFQGVIDKVDYLNEMGINMVYFGPFHENGGGIWGYNIDDIYKHEGKFGGTSKYIEMMKTLRNHNIKVMMDWVPGQVGGPDSPTAKKHPTYYQPEQFSTSGGGTKQEYAEPRALYLNNLIWNMSITDAVRFDNPKFWDNGLGPEQYEFNRALRKLTDRWDPQYYLFSEIPETAGDINNYTGNNGPMLHGGEQMKVGGYKEGGQYYISSWAMPKGTVGVAAEANNRHSNADGWNTSQVCRNSLDNEEINWKNEWAINATIMESHDERRFISRSRGDDGASWGYDSQVGYMAAITLGGPLSIMYGGEVGLEGPYDGSQKAKMDINGNVRLMEFDRVNVDPWTNVRPAIRRAIQAKANFAPLRGDPQEGGRGWYNGTDAAEFDTNILGCSRTGWGQKAIVFWNWSAGDITLPALIGTGDASTSYKDWLTDAGYTTNASGQFTTTIVVPSHYGRILIRGGYDWVNCTGTVTSGGSPVANAVVDIDQKSHWTVMTDANGYYSISGNLRKILTGSHTIRCWADGYNIATTDVNFTTALINNGVDFTLTTDNTPPSAPSTLAAQPRSEAVMLSWQPNTESDFQSYLIYRSSTEPIPDGSFPEPVFEVFKTFYYDNNLDGQLDSNDNVYDRIQNGTTYYYRIRAVDRNGNKSALSNQITVIPRAVKVKFWLDARDSGLTITSATVTGGALAFGNATYGSWPNGLAMDEVVDGVFQKEVEFDDTIFLEYKYKLHNGNNVWEGSSGQLFLDGPQQGHNRGELYKYNQSNSVNENEQVPDIEIKDEGNGEMILADKWQYYNDQAPRTPQGLEITAGPNQLTVGWTANAEPDLNYYTIRTSNTADSTLKYVQVSSAAINYVDLGLTNNVTYFYSVSATDRRGNTSGYSSVISDYPRATDTSAPSTPTGLEAVGAGTDGLTAIKVKWSQNYEGDLAGYNIYKSTVSGFTPDTTNKLNYTLICPTATYYTDSNITTGTTYYYKLAAVDSSGNSSPYTSQLSVNLFPITFEVDMGNITLTNVQIIGDTEPLDWTTSINLTQMSNSTTWYRQLGMVANSSIRYRYSYNNDLDNKEQNFNTASTDREYTIPYSTTTNYDDWEENPDAIAGTLVYAGYQKANLYWDRNTTAEELLGYNIYRNDGLTSQTTIQLNASPVSYSQPYTVEGLTLGNTYSFLIRAVDSGGQKLESSTATVVSCWISNQIVYVNFGVPYTIGLASSPWGDSSKIQLQLAIMSSTQTSVWSSADRANITNGKLDMTADATNKTYRASVPLIKGQYYNFLFFAETTATPPDGLKANTVYYDCVWNAGTWNSYSVVPSTAKFITSKSSTSITGNQYGWFGNAGKDNDARRILYVDTTLDNDATWYVFANFASTPTAPTYIQAIPGNQKVTLVWSAPYGNAWIWPPPQNTGNVPASGGESMKAADVVCGGVYQIYVCTDIAITNDFSKYQATATVSGSSFTYTSPPLKNGVTYYYIIRASDTFKGIAGGIDGNCYSVFSATVSACPTNEYVVVKIRVNKGAEPIWRNVRKTIAFQEGQTVSAWDEVGRSNLTSTGRAVNMTAPADDSTEQEFSVNLAGGTTYNFILFAYSTFTISGLTVGTTYYDTVPTSGSNGMATSTSTANITSHGSAWYGNVGATGDSRRLLYVPRLSQLGGGATLYVYCNFAARPTQSSVYATAASSYSILLMWTPYGAWGTDSESFKAADVIAGGFYYVYRSSVSASGPYVLWASTDVMSWTDDDKDTSGDNKGLIGGNEYFYVIVASDAYKGASGQVAIPNLYRTGAPEFSTADASFTPGERIPLYFKVERKDIIYPTLVGYVEKRFTPDLLIPDFSR